MPTPIQRVRGARTCVQLVLNLSKGASLADLARVCECLHGAATELRALDAEFHATGIPDLNGKFRAEMALLRRDMSAAGRVIDAGSALYRGLTARIGGPSLAYSPRGCQTVWPPASRSVEIKG